MLITNRLRLLLAVVLVGLSVLSACNCQQAPPVPSSGAIIFAQPSNDIKGLANFALVADGLYRDAQPDQAGFAELKKLGIKTVINLRSSHSDREMMAGLGLQYFEINSDAGDITDEHVAAFLKAALNPANQPVFVHCAHGADRTGTMVAVYRIYVQDWPNRDALNETDLFGRHKIYSNIPQYIMGFDKEAMKLKVQAAPEPKIEVIE